MHSFLIDECLSPALVALAHGRGSSAVHVAHVGLAGVKDRSLMPFIRQGSHTLVTNNRIDFRLLHAAEELHDGLIVIVPNVSRDEQQDGHPVRRLGVCGLDVFLIVQIFRDRTNRSPGTNHRGGKQHRHQNRRR